MEHNSRLVVIRRGLAIMVVDILGASWVPIDPPDKDPPPKWAQTLVRAANGRNRAREARDVFSMDDLAAAWASSGGQCAFSGLPFSFEVVGNGQAKRPYAPSLDRIDRHQPYRRGNVRLVVAVANFAMNAWGDKPVLQMATALHKKFGDRRQPSAKRTPSDSDLDGIAVVDTDLVETNAGTLAFPSRLDIGAAILERLRHGSQSSRALEDFVAERFGVTPRMRAATLRSGCPAWRNHVAWALVDLGKGDRGSNQIERLEGRRAPDGGTMGIYRLKHGKTAYSSPVVVVRPG